MSGGTAQGLPSTDGRTLRTERSRRLVVEAFLDLLQEGESQPTAQQVADRSGVSMRSIFRLFQDIDALHSAAIAAQLERVAHLFEAPNAEGPVERRVTALAASRARLYETIAPVRRMAVRLAPRSRPIQAELTRANEHLRGQLTELFAGELDAMDQTQRTEVVEALDAVTSWEAWERLRTTQQVSVRRATRVVATVALSALRSGASGKGSAFH